MSKTPLWTDQEVADWLQVSLSMLQRAARSTPKGWVVPWRVIGGSAARPMRRWPGDEQGQERILAWLEELTAWRHDLPGRRRRPKRPRRSAPPPDRPVALTGAALLRQALGEDPHDT